MSNEQICKYCGKPVADDFKICPYCGNNIDCICKFCGKQINEDFKVCPYCGTNVDNYKNTHKNNSLEENNGNFSKKNSMVCLMLMLFPFLSPLSVSHKFYVGRINEAIIFVIANLVSFIILCVNLCMSEMSFIVDALSFYNTGILSFSDYRELHILPDFIVKLAYIYLIVYLIIWVRDLILLIKGKFRDSKGKYLKKL